MHQKDVLKMEPSAIQFATGILSIPWCIKPVIGFVLDRVLQRYRSSSIIFIFTSLIMIVLLTILSHFSHSAYVFYVANFCFIICVVALNIVSEYLLCLTTQKESKESGSAKNNFPIYFGPRGLGSLVGNFFGGRILEHHPSSFVFFITSFIPIFILFLAMIHQEPKVGSSPPEKRPIREELKVLANLLSKSELLLLVTCIGLINICPNFDSISNYYLTESMSFSTNDLADLSTISAAFYILGLIFYYRWLLGVSAKKLFLFSNVLLWFGNVSFMALVLHWVQAWGINPKIFCLANYGIYSFIAELNMMPVFAIWTAHVPPGLEATSITLFTGIINLTNNLGNYTGTAVSWIIGVSSKNIERLWLALLVQNIYLILVVVAIFFIPLKEPTIEKKENSQHYEIVLGTDRDSD